MEQRKNGEKLKKEVVSRLGTLLTVGCYFVFGIRLRICFIWAILFSLNSFSNRVPIMRNLRVIL